MKPSSVDTLIWVLIYGGLLLASLAVFVGRGDAAIGWALGIVGAVLASAGAVLVWVRSRMKG